MEAKEKIMCENNVKILFTGCYSEVCNYLDNCENKCEKYYGCYTVSLLNKKLENMESVCNNPEYSSIKNFLKEELGEYYFNNSDNPTMESSYEMDKNNRIISLILECYPLTITIKQGSSENSCTIFLNNSDSETELYIENIPSQDLILLLNSFNISINPESLNTFNQFFKPNSMENITTNNLSVLYFLYFLEQNNFIKITELQYNKLPTLISTYNNISAVPEILIS